MNGKYHASINTSWPRMAERLDRLDQ